MSIICKLGKYLITAIVSDWVYVEEIALFDSAICSTKLRSLFLDCISMKKIHFQRKYDEVTPSSFLKWLCKRVVKTELSLNVPLLNVCQVDLSPILGELKSISVGESNNEIHMERLVELLCKVVSVERIKVEHCQHADRIISNCSHFWKKLQHIDLNGSKISNAGLIQLVTICPRITSINLCWCKQLTDVGIEFLIKRCGNDLKFIDISYAKENLITDKSVLSISQYCPNLTHFSVGMTEGVTVKSMIEVCTACRFLTILNISDSFVPCKTVLVNDVVLKCVGLNCVHLLRLDVSHCDEVTDLGVKYFCEGCPRITDLHLEYLSKITLKSIIAVASSLHYLRSIRYQTHWCNHHQHSQFAFYVRAWEILTSKFDKIFEINTSLCSDVIGEPKHTAVFNPRAWDDSNNIVHDTESLKNVLLSRKDRFADLKRLVCCPFPSTLELLSELQTPFSLLRELDIPDTPCGYPKTSEKPLADRILLFFAQPQISGFITTVSCSFDTFPTDDGMCAFIERNPNLTDVSAHRATGISDLTLSALAEHCHKLKTLALFGMENAQITDGGLCNLSEKIPGLTDLCFHKCNKITDEGLRTVMRNCRELTSYCEPLCFGN